MKDIIVWVIHTPAGAVALVASVVIVLTKKGTQFHRKAGHCFTVSMLIMLLSALVAATLKESTGDVLLSAVILYTVSTAWLSAHHKKIDTGALEYVALVWIIAVGVAAAFLHTQWTGGEVPNMYPFWAILATLCAIGDIRNIVTGGLTGIHRITRHVWRMGFSLLWATLALTDKIIKIQGSDVKQLPTGEALYIVAVPTSLVLMIMLYWIIDILYLSRKKFSQAAIKPE